MPRLEAGRQSMRERITRENFFDEAQIIRLMYGTDGNNGTFCDISQMQEVSEENQLKIPAENDCSQFGKMRKIDF